MKTITNDELAGVIPFFFYRTHNKAFVFASHYKSELINEALKRKLPEVVMEMEEERARSATEVLRAIGVPIPTGQKIDPKRKQNVVRRGDRAPGPPEKSNPKGS